MEKVINSSNPKISIIIPVYNVEEYLPKCLNSVINQTLTDIEIICINDGSTDNSLEILNEFAKQDRRITIINKENEGVSKARNFGLKRATGKYLMFVDSDDWLELTACEEAYQTIEKDNSDLVIFNYYTVKGNTKWKYSWCKKFDGNECFCFNEAIDNIFYVITSMWGKLIRRSFNNVLYNENLQMAEDAVYLWELLLKNPKISVLATPLYNYLQRSSSAMYNIKIAQNNEIFKSINYLLSLSSFQNSSPYTQVHILDRFAQSVEWKLSVILKDTKLTKEFYSEIEKFIKYFEQYESSLVDNLRYYKKLKKTFKHKKYTKLIKISNAVFSVCNTEKHKVLTILGVKFKFKYLKGSKKLEQYYINKIKKTQKKYPKDTYLLFDCLFDSNAENIDAYSLFIYMKNSGYNVFYAVLKDSQLYMRLKEKNAFERIIIVEKSTKDSPYQLLKDCYNILVRTKCIISSFGEWHYSINKFLKKLSYLKYIFIQHGQIFFKESVMYKGYLFQEKFDKILISSEMEYKIFKKYNWDDEKFIKCGLPRWDLLQKNNTVEEKSIFIMFTFREISLLQFQESYYKKRILTLLNNKDLLDYININHVKLYFALHHSLLTNYGIDFKINNENVKIIDMNNISEYIKKSSCLITDFSSVAFDFMFQDKPVLFYLLDKDDPILNKFDREDMKRFEYKKYLISNVCYTENELINRIKHYVESNFELEPDIKEKYDRFFYTKENIREKLTKEIERLATNS